MERVKRRILAGLSAVALTAAAIAAAAPAVSAATPQCGSSCVTWDSEVYRSADVVAVLLGRTRGQGTLITLASSGPNATEDFAADYIGTTTQLWDDGIVSIEIAKNWPSQPMYQYQYVSDGQGSNLCIGTAAAAGIQLWAELTGVL